ncbi:MAG: ABC transporter ATP-binding protein [Candidatus Bipolaricaulia bacterium]
MTLMTVERLTKRYGGLHAVADVSFRVDPGQIVGLIGDNGAGKTTLFNLLSGFVAPTSGQIDFRGRDITGWSPERRARQGLVRTFQRSRVFPEVSVEENVRMGCFLQQRRRFRDRFRIPHGERGAGPDASPEGRVAELLELAGLWDFRKALAGHLSFGYQRRLAIAIALGAQPELLLLDEPFAGLSPESSAEMDALIQTLRARGVTLLLIEHRMASIVTACDRLLVMQNGRLIIPRPTSESGSEEVVHAVG